MLENTNGWAGMNREQVDGSWIGLQPGRDASYYGDWLSVRAGDVFYVAAWAKNKDAQHVIRVGIRVKKNNNLNEWLQDWLQAGIVSVADGREWHKVAGYVSIPNGY